MEWQHICALIWDRTLAMVSSQMVKKMERFEKLLLADVNAIVTVQASAALLYPVTTGTCERLRRQRSTSVRLICDVVCV